MDYSEGTEASNRRDEMTKQQLNAREKADTAYFAHLAKHNERAADPAAWHATMALLVAAQRAA